MNISISNKDYVQHIVQTYSDMIFRIAYHNLLIKDDADDIVQEVLIKLLKTNEFIDEEYLKAWLITVTINQCKTATRNYLRKRTEELTDVIPEATPKDMGLMEEIRKLPLFDRNIIYLYYYEGYNAREIGSLLGKSENTISSRLTRARKKLKMILEEDGGFSYE